MIKLSILFLRYTYKKQQFFEKMTYTLLHTRSRINDSTLQSLITRESSLKWDSELIYLKKKNNCRDIICSSKIHLFICGYSAGEASIKKKNDVFIFKPIFNQVLIGSEIKYLICVNNLILYDDLSFTIEAENFYFQTNSIIFNKIIELITKIS